MKADSLKCFRSALELLSIISPRGLSDRESPVDAGEPVLNVKPLSKFPGKWVAVLIAAALGVAGLGIFLSLRPLATPQNTTAPTPSPDAPPRPTAISALGRLEPAGEVIRVAPPSALGSSRLIRLMIREGGEVKTGQVIAVMDSYDRLLASALQAQAQVQEAQTRVVQVQAGAKQAEIQAQQAQIGARQAEIARRSAEFENAQREYQRYENLYKEGATSRSTLDQRRLTLETADGALRQAVKELEQAERVKISLVETRPVDIQQAQAQLQVAIANLQRAKAELETSAVRSPITGQVLKIHAREGEQVGNQFGSSSTENCNCIAELGKTDQMYAVAEVYETDVAKIRRGQKATITSAAFSGPISGTVEQVGLQVRKNDVLNTDPAANTDARVVEVKIRLDDSRLVAGMTNLQVNVEIAP